MKTTASNVKVKRRKLAVFLLHKHVYSIINRRFIKKKAIARQFLWPLDNINNAWQNPNTTPEKLIFCKTGSRRDQWLLFVYYFNYFCIYLARLRTSPMMNFVWWSRVSIHFLENIGWVETCLSAKGCYLNTAPAPLGRLAREIKQLEKINTSRYLDLEVVQESLSHLSHVIPTGEKAFP